FLRITGRKKELIITAGGKNIAPAPIEGLIATSRYINQVCVIGDRRKYLTALVTLDPENIKEYADQNNIPYNDFNDLIQHEKIIALINAEIEEKNKQLPRYETIKKVRIVPEFTINNGLITPTMKLKKSVIMARYQDLIEEMYAE
ncbi:MAG: long-chain fatty acid--CoA ligase, partial [Calditrichaeota bacterium]